MRAVPVVEAKSHFSALLAAVEAGEEIAITRHGRPVARLIPPAIQTAADVFRPLWASETLDEFNLAVREDSLPEPVAAFD